MIFSDPPSGGRGGIRTPGGVAPTPVFKTGAFNHSATRPRRARVSNSCLALQASRFTYLHFLM